MRVLQMRTAAACALNGSVRRSGRIVCVSRAASGGGGRMRTRAPGRRPVGRHMEFSMFGDSTQMYAELHQSTRSSTAAAGRSWSAPEDFGSVGAEGTIIGPHQERRLRRALEEGGRRQFSVKQLSKQTGIDRRDLLQWYEHQPIPRLRMGRDL